jgi:hypothetical protein
MQLKIKPVCLCAAIAFALLTGSVNAQTGANKNYAQYPYWIKMMDDTNTNYFEAVLAFDTYWKDKEKPQAENERFEEAGMQDTVTKRKNIPYAFEFNKFKYWQIQVEPYVQNDGSILYPTQRLLMIQDERRATPINQSK